MSASLEDLARRAVACKGWRFMPGMLGWRTTHRGEQVRVRFVDSLDYQELVDPRVEERKPSNTLIFASGHSQPSGWNEVSTVLPDLRDPATLGCLLALVREVWKSPVAQVSPSLPDGYLWTCYINDEAEDRLFREKTEAEALVRALEAAS
jgi:hypothetical protein